MISSTRLSAACTDTDELHLHIRNRHSLKTKVYPMRLTSEGFWEINLDLEPGAYLYRFYRRSGTSLVYHSPDGGPHPMANAWDASLSIPFIYQGTTRVRFASEQGGPLSGRPAAARVSAERAGMPLFD